MSNLNKSFVLAIFLFVSTNGFAAGSGSSPKGKPFIAINDQIVEVEGAVSSLEEQVDLLVAKVDSIEERVGANEDAIGTLQEQNDALQALIDQNLTDIASIEAEILLLQDDIVYLQSLIASNEGDIASLQDQVDDNQALISSLQSALLMVQSDVISLEDGLQSQIDNNAALIAVLQDELAQMDAILSEKQDILDGRCPSGMALNNIAPDGTISCIPVGTTASTTHFYSMHQSVSVPARRTSTYTLTCPSGFWASSGGFRVLRGMDVLQSQQTFASNGHGWWWDFYSTSAYNQTATIGLSCFKF